MTLADRIAVLNRGRLEQVGPPLTLYHRPKNVFVAGFLGSPPMNLLPATLVAATSGYADVRLEAGGLLRSFTDAQALTPQAAVTVGIRPEHLTLAAMGLPARVNVIERLGSHTLLHLTLHPDSAAPLGCVMEQAGEPAAGTNHPVMTKEWVRVTADAGSVHLFDQTGHALPLLNSVPPSPQ
jgi:multiple sugar transport system ATP-binding protein